MAIHDDIILEGASEMVKTALFNNLLGGESRRIKRYLKYYAKEHEGNLSELATRLAKQEERAGSGWGLGKLYNKAKAGITHMKLDALEPNFAGRQARLKSDLSQSRKQQRKSLLQLGLVGGATALIAPKLIKQPPAQDLLNENVPLYSQYGQDLVMK